jgi:hypothetical protein
MAASPAPTLATGTRARGLSLRDRPSGGPGGGCRLRGYVPHENRLRDRTTLRCHVRVEYAGRPYGIHASGVAARTASDDVPIAHDLPVPVANMRRSGKCFK